MKREIKKYLINENCNLKEAIRLLEKTLDKCLIVIDSKEKLKGTITDGDIRRSILSGISLDDNIKSVYKKKPIKIYFHQYRKNNNYDNLFNQIDNFRVIPVVNKKEKVVDLLKWIDTFDNKNNYHNKFKNIDVVIMSGGEGKRLLPYTTIVPKPLVPVNEKAIVEHIIDKFMSFGMQNFYLTVGYKMNLIKAYFMQKKNKFKVNFISEKKPLGTVGSLGFLKKKIKKNFFLTNCDSIITSNYQSIYKFHEEKKLDLTIVSSKKKHHIPYGTCILDSKGMLASIDEKPIYNFLVNTGFYVVNPRILKFIKINQYLDMDILINFLLKKKFKIGVYPLDENSWLDFGQWSVFDNSSKVLPN